MSLAGLKYYLHKRGGLFFFLSSRGLLNWMPDEPYLKIVFYYVFGYKLDLEHPKTFNEKLQWLKLHDRNPLYTQLVDKYAVRRYVTEKLGEEYLVPLAGGPWDSVDEIDFNSLPDQFVLKCTHDSGSLIICRDKASFNCKSAKKKLAKALRRNYFWSSREWPYKDIRPRVYAELYLDGGELSVTDYKVMCFDGKVKITQLHMARYEHHTQDFYDAGWNLLNIRQGTPVSGAAVPRPVFYDKLCKLSEILAEGIPQVRVDWMLWNGQLFFGEMTLFDGSGLLPFDKQSSDELFGSYIHLPIAEEENEP